MPQRLALQVPVIHYIDELCVCAHSDAGYVRLVLVLTSYYLAETNWKAR